MMKLDTLIDTVRRALLEVDAAFPDDPERPELGLVVAEDLVSIVIVPRCNESVIVAVRRNDGSLDVIDANPKGGDPTTLILGRTEAEALGLGGRRG